MNDRPDLKSLKRLGICYSPYLAFVSVCADEPDVHSVSACRSQRHLEIATRMTTAAWQFRRSLESDYQDYQKASKKHSKAQLAHYLYNPIYWGCFGVADTAAVTLLDGFDPFLRLTGDECIPIERAYLAFCPTLKSLGIRTGGNSPFIEFPELFRDKAQPQPKSRGRGRDYENQVFTPAAHRFYQERPLLMAARLKTGFGGLESGLLFQRAIFRAIAQSAETTLDKLKKHLGSPELAQLEITKSDLQHTKIILADVQAAEDILVLITCTNYSVAASVIHAIRSLSLGDLENDPEGMGDQISQLMRNSRMWPKLFHSHYGKAKPFEGLKSFSGNHCFSTTYSVAGASHAALCHPDKATCHGIAEVHVRLDTSPGHFANTTDCVSQMLQGRPGEKKTSNHVRHYGPPEKFDRFSIGRYDFDISLSQTGEEKICNAVSVKSFFRDSDLLQQQFEKKASTKAMDGITGLWGMSSWLVIPVPRFTGSDALIPTIRPNHQAFPTILSNLQKSLFGIKTCHGKSCNLTAPLSIKRLQIAMRQLRIPWSLRQTIEYLFQNFSHCISNVFLFENVLDLLDIYEAFHLLLTVELPRKLGANSSSVLLAEHITMLSELVNAIHDATLHRVTIPLRSETHDWAVDVRGGLTRLAAAIDVPLKCGIGLLRWCRDSGYGETKAKGRNADELPKFAGIMRLSFRPDSVCRHIHLIPQQELCIAQLDINVGHLFFPADFAIYLHEAAHVILQRMYKNPDHCKGLPPENPQTVIESNQKQRAEEIFAEMLTSLFIFGDDWKLARRSYMAKYTLYPGSIRQNDHETLQRLTEILIRGFFATEPIRAIASTKKPISAWKSNDWIRANSKLSLEKFTERAFRNYIKEVCPLFSEYSHLLERCGEKAVVDYIHGSFHELFSPTLEASVQLWKKAIGIYQKYVKDRSSMKSKIEPEQLAKATQSALKSGQSWIQGALQMNSKASHHKKPHIDELSLVCQLIYQYNKFCFQKLDPRKGIHITRNDQGRIDYMYNLKAGQRPWNGFQLERGYPRLHCCDPGLRSNILKHEIVILKSLWDMSTILKARRFSRMLDGELKLKKRPNIGRKKTKF